MKIKFVNPTEITDNTKVITQRKAILHLYFGKNTRAEIITHNTDNGTKFII
ncbi:MAG: hypothetical protein K2J29_00245 [Muribaculaceae bacterium]|nr:hypothetical protein [Muribaculaceae bacterium]MDE7189207.1 hypothetical protein [Muribaculaceae bacterium]